MSAPNTWLLVSVTADEADRLLVAGPRRDFHELHNVTGGTLLFVDSRDRTRSRLSKLAGAHVRQAWAAADSIQAGDTVFADGEHNGIPLAMFLRMRGTRPKRFVMLGHLLTARWKRMLLGIASRLGVPATLVVHSTRQLEVANRVVGKRWEVRLVPYQVDTDFWRAPFASRPANVSHVVAVGSENRDYETLIEAARLAPGLHITIAAGSHWARKIATPGQRALPPNVTFITNPLGFAELRELYLTATAVVVPLQDVENQSGVTTILEAMSMGIPVIVSASRGQRECVSGPLIRADGTLDFETMADRGPQAFDPSWSPNCMTGVYVEPANPEALVAALTCATDESAFAGPAGIRGVAERCFGTDAFVASLARLLHARVPSPAQVGQS